MNDRRRDRPDAVGDSRRNLVYGYVPLAGHPKCTCYPAARQQGLPHYSHTVGPTSRDSGGYATDSRVVQCGEQLENRTASVLTGSVPAV
jgi:hypothetical protein